ncbi:hypothetical protein [Roseomonas populi]|uniref:Uncharacterized protein n=1 Tax=Roseomonas populi TaxID=3121582 RepID=A0ABT1X166_9PROT|nr:hypothetical protein [Roseomonas pecuniae]MCR0981851.1 hypothetical protein [Roseomonas pecuniae]
MFARKRAKQPGLSMRNLFAMAAIAGLFAGRGLQKFQDEGQSIDQAIASASDLAFKTAEAMMAHVGDDEPDVPMTPGKEGFATAALTGLLAGGGVHMLFEGGYSEDEVKECLADLSFLLGREMDRRTKLS